MPVPTDPQSPSADVKFRPTLDSEVNAAVDTAGRLATVSQFGTTPAMPEGGAVPTPEAPSEPWLSEPQQGLPAAAAAEQRVRSPERSGDSLRLPVGNSSRSVGGPERGGERCRAGAGWVGPSVGLGVTFEAGQALTGDGRSLPVLDKVRVIHMAAPVAHCVT